MIIHRLKMVEIGQRLYEREMVVGSQGNLSFRLDTDRILSTPTGVCKGRMRPDDLVEIDLAGKLIRTHQKKPSSEIPMHLAIYQAVPEAKAVVHAHPITATGFALAGLALNQRLMPEVILTFGVIPLVEYATPSTTELSTIVGQRIKGCPGLLLANHGAVTIGRDLDEAYERMEVLEHYARTVLVATLLNRPQELTDDQLDNLTRLKGAEISTLCRV